MNCTGTIMIEMFTAQEALPVTNGYAQITRMVNGTEVFSTSVYTDGNGQTSIVSVETPDLDLSFDPFAIDQPYYEYNIFAYADGFSEVIIQNVQVFPQNLTLQQIEMIPSLQVSRDTQASNRSQQAITYSIPPNALRQQGQSGPAPFAQCSGSWVLTEVYIPQNITVHLGKPSNTSARNVTIDFKSYIKNVACSEIYPTWPESALRANIYAQISLALNRVFTEWYKGKGYNYQITNSTQYDQYYVHGRNIFENISKIVDEIFNVYIRKTGDFEPYYAEYCNGTTSTCSGMSQWGTVDLANRGYSPINILKSYYGNDTNLIETNNIKAIQESYGGVPLRLGSTGFDVSVIQRQLNRIAKNYPAIGKVTVDANFGETTQRAVKVFQKIFNLAQDGIVGKATWYKISGIYVGVKKLAELGSEGEPFPPAGNSPTPPSGTIKQGDTGGGVSFVQYMLSYLSSFYTQITTPAVDGIFGNGTKTAVMQFQTISKLPADGIVGATTWEALINYYNSLYMDINPNQSYPGQYYGTVLRAGSRGPQVKEMQFYLQFLSFYYLSIPKISVDGIFGNGTKTAVIAFQNYFGLVPDGAVGNETWTKLFEVFSGITNQVILPGETPGVYPGYVLRVGSSGQKVKELQFYLVVLSKVNPSIPIITIDGIFGNSTRNCVLAFQRYYGLAQDGVVGPATWNKVYSEYYLIRLNRATICNFVSISFPGYVLKQGIEGSIVKVLQYYNNYVGNFDPLLSILDINGIYDVETTEGVIEFQKARGICPTGEVDLFTWNQLYADYTALLQAISPECVPGSITYPGYDLSIGNSGVAVFELQGYLSVIGEFYCAIGFVAQTGEYTLETAMDVEAFQELFNLPVTGITDEATWNTIYNTYIDMTEISLANNTSNQDGEFISIYPNRAVDQVQTQSISKAENCINSSNPNGTSSSTNQKCVCDIVNI